LELFTSKQHRNIVKALIELWSDNQPIDPITISNKCQVLASDLIDMQLKTFTFDFEADFEILKQQFHRRKVNHVLTKLVLSMKDESLDPDSLASEAIAELSSIIEPDRKTLARFDQVAEDLMAMVEAGNIPEPIPTGFSQLDLMLSGGLRRGELTIIAGRPSMGKSTIATQIAVNVASRGKKALTFPIEMSADSLAVRIIASESNIEPAVLRNCKYNTDWNQVRKNLSKLKGSDLWIDDDSAITTQKAIATAKNLAARLKGMDLIILDYVQRLSDIPNENRNNYLGAVTKRFASLARQLDCPVVLVSQLSRKTESRSESRPAMADLRDSGEIEQDADVIMLLYREHYYNKSADPNKAEVIIAKQRNGPTDTVPLHWDATRLRFSTYENRY
jgi:replicative DNA helicase